MNNFFKRDNLLIFAGGALAAIVGVKVMKSTKTRASIVKAVAKGMIAKDYVMEEYTNIREEAEDICAEARELAAAKSEAEECEAEECTEAAE